MSDLYTITGEMLNAARDVDAMDGKVTHPYEYYARIYKAMRAIEPPTPPLAELRDVPFKTPNGVIVLDSQLSEGMARRLKAEWEKKYTKGDSLGELFDRLLLRSKRCLVFDGHDRPHSAVAVKISDVEALRRIVSACVVSLLVEETREEAEPWACSECGEMSGEAGGLAKFEVLRSRTDTDCDIQCVACGSVKTGEAREVLKSLVRRVDTAEAALRERILKEGANRQQQVTK